MGSSNRAGGTLDRLSLSDRSHGFWDANAKTFEVRTLHALHQVLGYIKFARNRAGPVYYRGQKALFGDRLVPSAFRAKPNQHLRGGLKTQREKALKEALNVAAQNEAFIKNTPEEVREPLLQHYGYSTRWLDLVDNVWIALWFGVHECVEHRDPGGDDSRVYWFYGRRRPKGGVPAASGGVSVPAAEGDYAYIVLFQPEGMDDAQELVPGLEKSATWMVVDLRRAAPSIYTRPHAQHGLLVRRSAYPDVASTDISDGIVGRIRVHLSLAEEWLGVGQLLSVHHLFPPPYFDRGYERLLSRSGSGGQAGTVAHINP